MKSVLLILCFLSISLAHQEDKFTILRERMVEKQIVSRGISDKRTIEAMRSVPRHLFVPEEMADVAYQDSPLPIGYNQTISQPYIVALMTELSNPTRDKKALEIGTGSGYQAAVLAQVVDSVYTIEIITALANQSSELFRKLGFKNIISKAGDGYQGWAEHAPFDIIIVTAAPDKVPEPLIEQLAENGRMVIPVGDPDSYQELILLTRKNGKISQRRITTVRFVPFRRL